MITVNDRCHLARVVLGHIGIDVTSQHFAQARSLLVDHERARGRATDQQGSLASPIERPGPVADDGESAAGSVAPASSALPSPEPQPTSAAPARAAARNGSATEAAIGATA
jgi:hypothetical protein